MGPHGAQGLKLPLGPLWEPHWGPMGPMGPQWGPMGPIGAPGLKINKNHMKNTASERAVASERAQSS